jgi:hypothetical protein
VSATEQAAKERREARWAELDARTDEVIHKHFRNVTGPKAVRALRRQLRAALEVDAPPQSCEM